MRASALSAAGNSQPSRSADPAGERVRLERTSARQISECRSESPWLSPSTRRVIAASVLVAACGDGRDVPLGHSDPVVGQGGTVITGGSGGSAATGGTEATGGIAASGSSGTSAAGQATGGTLSAGRGGAAAQAGTPATGGTVESGGTTATEGSAGTAGTAGTGGTAGITCEGEPVDAARAAFLDDIVGFAQGVTGGLDGCLVHVTSLENAGAGTLREAAGLEYPAWIVFDLSGEIQLTSPIVVSSNKTIDGRGQLVTIRGFGLDIESVDNVIVENMSFDGGSDTSDDAIAITRQASGVWIDHCSLTNYGDGLLDVTFAATNITVSFSHFFDHNKVMLIGDRPEETDDVAIRLTMHHNLFERNYTYQPRLRFGFVHSFNNLFAEWEDYATGASMSGQLLSESNIYVAGDNTEATIVQVVDDEDPGFIRSAGDWAENDSVIIENEPEQVANPADFYTYQADTDRDALEANLRASVGPQ